jgi:hypothetical protein
MILLPGRTRPVDDAASYRFTGILLITHGPPRNHTSLSSLSTPVDGRPGHRHANWHEHLIDYKRPAQNSNPLRRPVDAR